MIIAQRKGEHDSPEPEENMENTESTRVRAVPVREAGHGYTAAVPLFGKHGACLIKSGTVITENTARAAERYGAEYLYAGNRDAAGPQEDRPYRFRALLAEQICGAGPDALAAAAGKTVTELLLHPDTASGFPENRTSELRAAGHQAACGILCASYALREGLPAPKAAEFCLAGFMSGRGAENVRFGAPGYAAADCAYARSIYGIPSAVISALACECADADGTVTPEYPRELLGTGARPGIQARILRAAAAADTACCPCGYGTPSDPDVFFRAAYAKADRVYGKKELVFISRAYGVFLSD